MQLRRSLLKLAAVYLFRQTNPSLCPLQSAALASDAQLNNSIIGDPFVSCAADAIYAKWKTNEAFVGGHVNVRYTPNRYCYQVLVTNNQIELLVPHLDCSLNRLRVLDPSPGLVIEATILISFHDQFVTAGDRLFILRCFYSRHLNRNSQNVTNEVPENVQLKPIEGRLTIGTKLYHNWTCENARATQCLVITNCVMRTQDTEHKLIDDRGCSLVPTLVPELRYNGQHNAEQIMQLFSTIDQSFVHYQCQLNLVEYNSSSGDVNVPFSCPFPEYAKSRLNNFHKLQKFWT
ncbi:cuticlin-1 [Ditylenchus destructor]|nr:cuticlin-1 [Ditylenchus destructor]